MAKCICSRSFPNQLICLRSHVFDSRSLQLHHPVHDGFHPSCIAGAIHRFFGPPEEPAILTIDLEVMQPPFLQSM